MGKSFSTKEKIFAASLELFSSKGYRNSSMRDIAEHVNIKPSSIYNHYKSKEDILKEALGTLQNSVNKRLKSTHNISELSNKMTFEKIIYFICPKIDSVEEYRMIQILTMLEFERGEASKLPRKFLFDIPLEQVKSVFSSLISEGILKPFDYDPISYVIVSCFHTTIWNSVIQRASFEEMESRSEMLIESLSKVFKNYSDFQIKDI